MRRLPAACKQGLLGGAAEIVPVLILGFLAWQPRHVNGRIVSGFLLHMVLQIRDSSGGRTGVQDRADSRLLLGNCRNQGPALYLEVSLLRLFSPLSVVFARCGMLEPGLSCRTLYIGVMN